MHVRVTGVVIEDDQVLLLNQDTGSGRAWSLPGGKVEESEPLGAALAQEMREETGIEVEVGRLLYVCDYLSGATHVVHVTFEATRIGGIVGDVTEGADTRPIRGVEFVKLADLPSLGFTEKFGQLAMSGFPGAGSYMGANPTSACELRASIRPWSRADSVSVRRPSETIHPAIRAASSAAGSSAVAWSRTRRIPTPRELPVRWRWRARWISSRVAGVFQAAPWSQRVAGLSRSAPDEGPSQHQTWTLPIRWWISSAARSGSVTGVTSPNW